MTRTRPMKARGDFLLSTIRLQIVQYAAWNAIKIPPVPAGNAKTKKRTANPGVRQQGGRIYDSENGTTCHQVRGGPGSVASVPFFSSARRGPSLSARQTPCSPNRAVPPKDDRDQGQVHQLHALLLS